MVASSTKVVQVTNIAPQATKDQMQTLFGYLGKIEDIRLYPTIRDVSCPVQSRICYVKFVDTSTVGIAQHMTNTVFIDRALIVIPVQNGDIPDEYYALEMTRNGTIVPGFNVNEPKLPPNVTNSLQGSGIDQVIMTNDPQLDVNGLMPYPPLPYNYDSIKVEETRRTVLVSNIDQATPIEEVIDYFNKEAGEVKYIRSCETDDEKHILVEFTEQPSIIKALLLNGNDFKNKSIKIQHATQPIVKPQAKSNEAAQKEIEEAMSRFKEAQNMINASIEPVIGLLTKDKRSSRRSRSRSRGRRRRSRSRSRSRRSRSRRSRSRRRSHSRKSRSRERRKRSKSHSRKRSRSRSRRRSRETSKSRRTRSKSPHRKHRSKDRDSRDQKSRDRSRERKRGKSKDKDNSSRSSKSRSSKKNDKDNSNNDSSVNEKKRSRSRSRSRSRRRSRSKDRKRDKNRKRSRSKNRKRSPTPRNSRKRSRSHSRDKKKDKKDKKKERSSSISKIPRNYDEEERGFDSEKDRREDHEKESSEKSDNMDISNSP